MLFRILKWKFFLIVGFLALYGFMAILPGADGVSWERHDLTQAQIDNNQVTMTAIDDGAGSIVFSFEPALGSLYGVKCDGLPGMFTNRMVGDARGFYHFTDISNAGDIHRPIYGTIMGAIEKNQDNFQTITSEVNKNRQQSLTRGTIMFMIDDQTNWDGGVNSRPVEDYTQKKMYMYIKRGTTGGNFVGTNLLAVNGLFGQATSGNGNMSVIQAESKNTQTPHLFFTVTDIDDQSFIKFGNVVGEGINPRTSISYEYSYWFHFLPQDYTTFQVMQSTILQGNASSDVVMFSDIQKGDFAFVTTTAPTDIDIGPNRLYQLIDLSVIDNKLGTGYNVRENPYEDLYRAIVVFGQDYPTYDLIEPHEESDYSVAIHIRPVWKLDPFGGLLNPDQVAVPKYLLTNFSVLHCVGYAFDNVIFDNDFYFRQSNAVTVPVSAYCRPDDTFTIPASNLTETLGLTWNDIKPNNYCNFSPTAPVPSIPKPDPGNGTEVERLYGDILTYSFGTYGNPQRDNVLFIHLTEKYVWSGAEPGTCNLKDDLSGEVYENRNLASGFNANMWFAPINETTPAELSKLAPLTIKCENLNYRQSGTITNTTLDFQRTIPAVEPYFKLITADLDNDVFGWGIGTDEFGFSNDIMGMSFMGIMILFSAIAGFQRFNLPASLIIFLGIHGAAMYLELVPIENLIISGIIVLAILGIFSKGIR